jgi:hypothetical protein
MEHRGVIDLMCPLGELSRVVANGEREGIEGTLSHVSEGKEIQVIKPFEHCSHTWSMKAW